MLLLLCVLTHAGQFSDAAYSLVQLRKILEDSSSSGSSKEVLPGSEVAALQEACAACERNLEEVCVCVCREGGQGGGAGGFWGFASVCGAQQMPDADAPDCCYVP